tara:strand:- start:1957 stop:2409 length:453 start_codon:yes stop_codon:yes gene_type:complete
MARLDWKTSVTPIEQTSAGADGGGVQTDVISYNFQTTLGGGNSSQAWAGTDSTEWSNAVCTHVSSEDTSTIVTSGSDGLWIKHTGYKYDAGEANNKGTTANTDNLVVKIGTTQICKLGPGQGLFLPKPYDATWQLGDDGAPIAVEYAVFT